jgi:hypothetical protein
MWSSFLRSLLILWFSCFLYACGYTLAGKPTLLNPEWKTIYIPPWKNYTGEKAVGELLAQELRKKIAQDGFLIPVFSPDSADLILQGEVLKVYFEPVAYATFGQTKTRNIQFEGKFALIEIRTAKKIYENPKITRYETYRVKEDASNLLNPGKDEALRLLVKDLSELIMQELFNR